MNCENWLRENQISFKMDYFENNFGPCTSMV